MRERRLDTVGLRVWGRQLDDAQFGRAISALGALLAASKARDATVFQQWAAGIDFPKELTRLIAPRPDGRRRIAWTISPLVDAKGKVDEIQQLGLDPLQLADAWAAALAQLPGWDPRGAPSFEVRAANFDLASHAQIGEWLGPRGAMTASFVADPELGTGSEFEWPVRVAVVPGPGSDLFLERLRTFSQSQHAWVLNLVEFVTPMGPEEPCDILLTPRSLREAVEALAYRPARDRRRMSHRARRAGLCGPGLRRRDPGSAHRVARPMGHRGRRGAGRRSGPVVRRSHPRAVPRSHPRARAPIRDTDRTGPARHRRSGRHRADGRP